MGETGKVVGIDHISNLVKMSKRNISKQHQDWLETGQVALVEGDGRLGYETEAPYDCM